MAWELRANVTGPAGADGTDGADGVDAVLPEDLYPIYLNPGSLTGKPPGLIIRTT